MTPQQIRKLRRALQLTQQQLAEKIGAQQHTVARWQTGLNEPKGAYAKLLKELAEKVKRRRSRTKRSEIERLRTGKALDVGSAEGSYTGRRHLSLHLPGPLGLTWRLIPASGVNTSERVSPFLKRETLIVLGTSGIKREQRWPAMKLPKKGERNRVLNGDEYRNFWPRRFGSKECLS